MRLILVGGFLGAGKTTLLAEAARRLAQRNLTAGLITNDQAPDLVDTTLLSRGGSPVREVAGSCFCCNFDGLRDTVKSLAGDGVDCVIAEPVGSCTDLSATIVQPMKALHSEYPVAPLSVLVDPMRVRQVLREKRPLLHADAAYILHVQLEEADCIVLSKADTLSAEERDEMVVYLMSEFPATPVVTLSAKTGEGIDSWLDYVLVDHTSGAKIAVVDYDRYANGEAVLGWLNAVVALRWTGSLQPEWEDFVAELFALLHKELKESESEIGHIKMFLESARGYIVANLTELHDSVTLRREGAVDNLNAVLTVNARVQVSPGGIEEAFRSTLRAASHARVAPTIRAFHCLQPGRPEPTHRYTAAVG